MGEPDEPARITDLPSDVEHELVNSLASIIGFSQLIRRDASLPEDLRHSADLLVEEATRTRRMVEVLLDLVRERPTDRPTTAQRPADRPQDVASATTAATTASTANTGAARPSVLVLDDEPTFRIFLEKALVALGYDPQITARGHDALQLASTADPAVLLLDHQMSGMSGIEVYEAVVAAAPHLAQRVVLMSGDVLDPALEGFAANHPVTLLAKPFDLDTLDRTLRAVIDAASQSRG